MRRSLLLLPVAFAVLSFACGEGLSEGDPLGTQTHRLSSGTYVVSDATVASAGDQCGLFGAYADPSKRIGLSVSGSQVTFNLSNTASAPEASLDRATLSGTAIDQYSATSYTVAFDDTCVARIHRTVTGTVVGPDTAELTLDFSVSTEAGSCGADNSAFDTVPCSATYQFTATRQ